MTHTGALSYEVVAGWEQFFRRYTRLTNAFSKKLEQHVASTALLLANYNFVRQHKTLRASPAMAAGICSTLWNTDMKRELEHMARFLQMAKDYARKQGFRGTFFIEPKPMEPMKHQYDYDCATVIGLSASIFSTGK